MRSAWDTKVKQIIDFYSTQVFWACLAGDIQQAAAPLHFNHHPQPHKALTICCWCSSESWISRAFSDALILGIGTSDHHIPASQGCIPSLPLGSCTASSHYSFVASLHTPSLLPAAELHIPKSLCKRPHLWSRSPCSTCIRHSSAALGNQQQQFHALALPKDEAIETKIKITLT